MPRLRDLIFAGALLPAQVACGVPQASQNGPATPAASPTPELLRRENYPSLKRHAERWAAAYEREDYSALASLTYPRQVELMGGPEGMAKILSRALKAEGTEVLSTVAGEPEEVTRVGPQLFAIVPTTLRMKSPRGTLMGDGFLIGVSDDGGATWTFVDGSGGRNEAKIKTLLPAAAGKLRLPELGPLVLESGP